MLCIGDTSWKERESFFSEKSYDQASDSTSAGRQQTYFPQWTKKPKVSQILVLTVRMQNRKCKPHTLMKVLEDEISIGKRSMKEWE